MSIVTAPLKLMPAEALPPTNLPAEDGIPLESDWHRLAMTLLIEVVSLHFEGREDYFVGGNMFIYFDAQQAKDRNFRGPDFFFVDRVPLNPPRRYWAVWNEGSRFPDVIVELTSPTTREEDFGIKRQTYEQIFRTREYFIYDPAEAKLIGWRLDSRQRYRKISPNSEGRMWCEGLGLLLGTWKGKYQQKHETYLRVFNAEDEMIASAWERANAEKCRANTAEAEVARLQAKLRKAQKKNGTGGPRKSSG